MSDFYIFLEEGKGLNKNQIESLSDEELNRYEKEYEKSIEFERKDLIDEE